MSKWHSTGTCLRCGYGNRTCGGICQDCQDEEGEWYAEEARIHNLKNPKDNRKCAWCWNAEYCDGLCKSCYDGWCKKTAKKNEILQKM